ncbi:helix-turn-helix domain-containing protein [Caenibius sp. WL]|uniref:helix-turn-helix domain-containing protein n=1 Tax=Caenibius sp. WL TaxID=2872646 RepID=UPI001C99CBCB|nr:helix-turn-helix domain-containing protein [Caenibius sp. WL]QZP08187.1 helix-turn-helix domain-containing protein [Caenibius sp. WL]
MLGNDLIRGAKAAAAYCGLTPRLIYHLVERGELPAIRKSGTLFFRKSELERAFSSEGSDNA